MPRLSDEQFKDYEFRVNQDIDPTGEGGETTVVVGHHQRGYTGEIEDTNVLGSMAITDPGYLNQRMDQRQINRDASDWERHRVGTHHGSHIEPSGQVRFTGGTMEPKEPDRVSWVGMKEEAPKSVLRGMLALGVHAHGSMPVADYELSQYGAKIAQGAARKYGIQPNPRNPQMQSSFQYGESLYSPASEEARDEGAYISDAVAMGHWQVSNRAREMEKLSGAPLSHPGRRWESFSAAQVHGITQDVQKSLKQRLTVDPRVPVHPSQGKLF